MWLILIVVAIVAYGCDALDTTDQDESDGRFGTWRVTELSGHITNIGENTVPLLCEAFEEVYYPILGEENSYIEFVKRERNFDRSILPNALVTMTNGVDTGDVFVFYFSFDNGYYSNYILGDLGAQYFYESIFGDAYSFAGGTWLGDDFSGFIESTTGSGGFNLFSVAGYFVSDTKIEGTWSWTELAVFIDPNHPECNSHASGDGTWTAVKE